MRDDEEGRKAGTKKDSLRTRRLDDSQEVGRHRLDLFVESSVVVDLKTIRGLEDIQFAVVRSQLKAVGRQHGLPLNFTKAPSNLNATSLLEAVRAFMPSSFGTFVRLLGRERNYEGLSSADLARPDFTAITS